MAPLMYVLLAYGYLGDRFQAWYLKLCIQSPNYVLTIKFTKLISDISFSLSFLTTFLFNGTHIKDISKLDASNVF